MRKKGLFILIVLTFLITVNIFTPKAIAAPRKQSNIQTSLYNYLTVAENRKSVEKAAIRLNRGNAHFTCVYFTSESLRRIGYKVPRYICNNKQLTAYLKSKGWKVNYNLHELKPGDICFTANTNKGYPSHAYIFMGWVKEGSIDYAYIVDNQSYDYKGHIYHVRNVRRKLRDKDATKFFMYLPN